MPKIVDHEQRRKDITAATMRVIARMGLEATTVREIAREAGFSSGVLAHYFSDKQAILIMAHLAAFQGVTDRIIERTAGGVSVDHLRVALHEALPLDEQRLLEAQIDVSFWTSAILDPELRRVRTESYVNHKRLWIERLEALRRRGQIRCPESDAQLADEIVVMVDGLSAEALIHPSIVTPEYQMEFVEIFLARIQRP